MEVSMGVSKFVPVEFLLELDGKPVGRLSAVSLPVIEAEIVTKQTGFGGNYIAFKPAKLNEFSFKCGAGMARAFFDWVKETFQGKYGPKNGAIVAFGIDQVEKQRVEFNNALLTSVTMPDLNQASRDPAWITVHMTAEGSKISAGGAKLGASPYVSGGAVPWPASEFRISIDKLEKECSAITEVSSVGIGTKVQAAAVGQGREPVMIPASSSVSDVTITLPMASSEPFLAWSKQTLEGKNPPTRTATIEYMSTNSKATYFTLNLTGVGIISAEISKAEKSQLPTKMRMYAESIDFSAGSAAVR
jgi:tail tube protein gp19